MNDFGASGVFDALSRWVDGMLYWWSDLLVTIVTKMGLDPGQMDATVVQFCALALTVCALILIAKFFRLMVGAALVCLVFWLLQRYVFT